MRDEKACAHSDADHGLSPEMQAEVDRAEKDSTTLVIDLTLDSDSDADCDTDSVPATGYPKVARKGAHSGTVPRGQGSGEQQVFVSEKAISPNEPPALAAKRPSETATSPPKRPRLVPQTKSQVHPWRCGTCTYDNQAKSIACEMCETARPDAATAAMTASTATLEFDDGWVCHVCGRLMDHMFWTCTTCATVKQSSTRS